MALTDKQKTDVIRLYHAGHTVEHIAQRTGVGRSSVYYVLGQYGIKPNRPRGRNAQARQEAVRQGRTVNAELAREVVELRGEVKQLRDILNGMEALLLAGRSKLGR